MSRPPRGIRTCCDCTAEFGFHHTLQFRCKPCQARYKNRRPKRYTKPCNRCGEQFNPRSTRHKTCASCRVSFPCKVCGETAARSNPGKLYCSTRCQYLAKTIAKHGNTNYFAALKRDGFKCSRCAADSGLHVHHIDGAGLGYDMESRNNTLDNLITLCNSCHGTIHAMTARELYARHPDTVQKVLREFLHSSCAPQR